MSRASACSPAKRPSSTTSWARCPTQTSRPSRARIGNSQYVFGIRCCALVLVEAQGLLAVVVPHEVEERPAAQLRLPVAERLGGGGIDVDEAAMRVGAEDDVVGRLDDPAEASLRPTSDRRLGARALDVGLALAQHAERSEVAAGEPRPCSPGARRRRRGRRRAASRPEAPNAGTVRPRRETVKRARSRQRERGVPRRLTPEGDSATVN